MNVPNSLHVLASQVALWIERVKYSQKQAAFRQIKRKLLREDIKKINKGGFQSVNSTSDNDSNCSLTNFNSINDFRPLQQNYTSVKILDYDTLGTREDLRKSRTKKIQISSSQLFVKETFLESWMVRQSACQLLPDNYPFSDYALRKITAYHEEALNTVRKLTFSHYCKQYLRSKTGFFGNNSDPLKYKRSMISRSLTNLQGISNQIALDAFQFLLRAGGDQESSRNYLYQISQLVELARHGDDAIREQVFLQVIKQASSCKLIYMRIMCTLCCSIKVPTRLYVPLLNYFYEEDTIFNNFPKELLSFCFYHTIKNFDRDRQYSPSLFELYCAFHASKVPLIMRFPREKAFFIESYTTVEELMSEVIEFFCLDSSIQYLLQVNGYLMERGNLLDNLNYYSQSQEEDHNWKQYKKFRGLFAVITLKNMEESHSSARCGTIMYNYCANQYLRGVYPLSSSEVVSTAALKMHSQLAEEENYVFQYSNLITKRKLSGLSSTERNNYKKHILKQYFNVRHLSKVQARERILNILSKSKGYCTHFFKCMVRVENFEQCKAWVGVQQGWFIMVEPNTGRMMRIISFSGIHEWGKSNTELCLSVDAIGKLHIESPQVDVLTSVYQTYTDYHAKLLNSL